MNKLLSFPNVSTIASFELISQTMNFNDLSHRHLDILVDQLKTQEFDITTIESANKIIHETSHYFDNLATLSGQVLLVKVYNALNQFESNAGKNHVIDLFNILRTWTHDHHTPMLTAEIYDVNFQNWSYSFDKEIGKDIFDNPNDELFMSTTFKHRGNSVGRVPFSIESLWETNAMWAEITYHFFTSYNLGEPGRIVEAHNMQNKYTEYLYNPELLVYSLAAHLTSSFTRLGDIFRAFKLSKAISSISLNLPFDYYSQIKRTRNSIFNGLANNLLEHATALNPCAIYLTLLENIVESQIDLFKDDIVLEIDEILAISGLPDKTVLNKDIKAYISQLTLEVDGPSSDLYNFHKKTGIHLFDVHGIEGGINVHPAFLIDLANKSQACVFQEDVEETDAYRRYNYYGTLAKRMRKKIGIR
ncbi:hypothetical protein [Priestia megaterium]|uniref:hypothetical protein n=1 Tax=Priestia megaterium TaxID=1404 RepID=UPI003A89BB6C